MQLRYCNVPTTLLITVQYSKFMTKRKPSNEDSMTRKLERTFNNYLLAGLRF